jgi:sedoheptulokinase
MEMSLIGLDIGTTTICGVLFSLKEKRAIKTLSLNNHFIENKIPGEYIQDPQRIYLDIKAILDELIDFSEQKIEALSLSAQMHGILYVNDEGDPVSPFYTWQNQRGLRQRQGQMLNEIVSEKLGYRVHSGYGIVTHYSLLEDDEVPKGAAKFCNIGDYIGMRLAGASVPVTDISLGGSMGLVDLQQGTLAGTLKNLPLLDEGILPALVSSTEVLGHYKGIPVIQALGDNQASFLGSVKEKETSLLLNYGTSGQVSFYRKEFAQYPHFETRALGNEGYIHVAFSLCGGHSYKILAGFFNSVVELFSVGEPQNILKIMDNLDLDFTTKDIDCLPLFLGERGEEKQLAYFKNVTDINFTPANMIKALVQGMIQELFRFYDELPMDVKSGMKTLAGAGNGIRKNRHLIKAAEWTYKKPLFLLKNSEESCLGAVINAGKGVGIFKDYSEGARAIVEYMSQGLS